MISIALFNNRGGVGTTTLVYHLAHMLSRLGHSVLAVDLDPQASLTSLCLDEPELEELWNVCPEAAARDAAPASARRSGRAWEGHSVADAVRPALEGAGDASPPQPVPLKAGLWLLPGSLGLGRFEDKLSADWFRSLAGDAAAMRTTTALRHVVQRAAEGVDADVALIDVGPSLGALNRAALLAADTVLTPLTADLFSAEGLSTMGPELHAWRGSWQTLTLSRSPSNRVVPAAPMTPLGYVIMQPEVRLDRPAEAYGSWRRRIPELYAAAVLDQLPPAHDDPYRFATLRNYRSLIPLAHDARKPMFDLKAADGALGSTQKYVQTCYREFRDLAENVLRRVDEVR
ncbi:ParA family protein [Streptomyces buecherae]|uniref:ParA family protein n=1 Tax=Streptomyces buecherae TaxID=2763006 RepID=A0A7H8N8F4_9ACTN|nr:ParA family protein [Streptomyces buecherae]QKW50653.1 ParA family protein [Streptomyces buecherae]